MSLIELFKLPFTYKELMDPEVAHFFVDDKTKEFNNAFRHCVLTSTLIINDETYDIGHKFPCICMLVFPVLRDGGLWYYLEFTIIKQENVNFTATIDDFHSPSIKAVDTN